ncbi:MAG: heme exporter protein CcmB [Chitinophagales bacterium]|nr:heme exporter protein CcmB [Chitinophagales bacterium]MCB9020354.1 heme exporter protein CcmB [Chitinophagales bacterium]MCB9021930.1 heme exporter protein CcmB [Chitinophagales bacterium]MCB9030819.1 heme exporter protein CcmB [Chitinophagales bacterium]HPE96876.1 ABC transporter permease [Chitinophagales bacterium]
MGKRSAIGVLFMRELRSEWRNKYAMSGILLYLLSIIFLITFTFEETDDRTWMVLYWIAILFTSVNAVAKSFLQESEGRQYYFYTLASPQHIILAKMAYNAVVMVVMSGLALLFYIATQGYPVEDDASFLLAMLLGALAFASTFSMISAVASRAANNGTLTAILSFPILLPVMRILIRVSLLALTGQNLAMNAQDLLYLAALNIFIVVLALILFPYLWRD